jgi:transcriptional regulator with XRE-family HTH domain
MAQGTPAAPKTLAERLDHLFRTAHPENRGPYTAKEVAEAINLAAGEDVISHSYVWQLRTGKKDNPTRKHIQALAAFFKVSPLYFFGEDDDPVESEIKRALRDEHVRDTALLAAGLSEQTLKAIQDMLNRARTLEGLPRRDESRRRRQPAAE